MLTTAAEVALKIQQEEETRMPRGKDIPGTMTLYDAENPGNPEFLMDTRVDTSMRSALELWR